ncbi:MAG: NADH-quinone oxidoreductase subunit L [Candidatus Omnitrophica bacterium]|nr:NADH-quinone oxidoreductase subunit L [Candidatus Omnitrophota bacterium]
MTLALIPLLPLASFAVLILIGRRLGAFAPAVGLAALAGSAVLSIRNFLALLDHSPPLHLTWSWFSHAQKPLLMGLQADPLSVTMCLVVTLIGWLIMLYSIGYMHGDPRFSRFFAYMSLFFAAMLTLLLADNFLLLYIGWEGVGLCSYLLISFWYEKPAAANAGKKAFITTRIGDLGLFAAILLIGLVAGDLSFAGLEAKEQVLGAWGPLAALLVFWGAAGKSAQFPLHVWLPDAMEGPTPVSALIHAATMVAAGVYLVARTLPLFLPNPDAMLAVASIGGFTALFAATIACTQTDLKRVLAYSTLSQLGLMMLGLGCGSAFASMFHLVTHAWFKALLFLGAGSVIHAVHHQEITRMGGLFKAMPVTGLTFLIASLAMAGIPPLAGFWSKEELLAAVIHFSHPAVPNAGGFFLVLFLLVSALTAFYIFRAVILTFAGEPREHAHGHAPHESPFVMTGPLLLLSVGAAGVGLLGSEWAGHRIQHFLGAGSHHAVPGWLAPVSVGVAAAGILAALLRYKLKIEFFPRQLRENLRPLYRIVADKYYIDEFYQKVLIGPAILLSKKLFAFDQKAVDGVVNGAGVWGLRLSRLNGLFDLHAVDGAVNGLALAFGRAGAALRLVQTGLVQNYVLIAAGSAIVLFILLG